MQRVSRAWRSFIHANRKMYTCLDFSDVYRAVSTSTLRAYLSRSGGNVREAILHESNDKSALSTIVRQCPELSILRTRDFRIASTVFSKETCIARNLAVLITDLRFSMNSFREILVGCVSLRRFGCEWVIWSSPTKAFTANLRCLEISQSEGGYMAPSLSEGLLVS